MPVHPPRGGGASVAVLIAALAGVALAYGLDVLGISSSLAQSEEAADRAEELAADHDHLLRLIAASDGVVARLTTAQLSLPEAVGELEAINRDRDGFAQVLEVVHPQAPTHRARLARYALSKAARHLADDPTRWAEVSARLEAEYCEMTNSVE